MEINKCWGGFGLSHEAILASRAPGAVVRRRKHNDV